MKKILPIIVLSLLIGCRLEDERTFTVHIPGLTAANQTEVVKALESYRGIRKDSYVWDLNAKTLTLRYDSMQLAKTNIRMAIAKKGIAVDFDK